MKLSIDPLRKLGSVVHKLRNLREGNSEKIKSSGRITLRKSGNLEKLLMTQTRFLNFFLKF